MVRVVLGVIAGFFAWAIVWFGGERVISGIWPHFGTHQAAFQDAIEHGGPFAADASVLIVHILLASFVSLIAGSLAAAIANENKRAPLILGFLLLSMGLLKAAMTWQLVPIWYHVVFTAILLPMAIAGGQLRRTN